MILKSLILQGFKSFPDRTEIRFPGGMTAIVGPNGSGKSNIADAIRWVLGEQSSHSLRGAKMEDVIFGGTAKRRAVGFAEVSLILDNSTGLFKSTFSELMVTRRYYRSGESEYFLNKKQCRLRDVHELFMDTGLGRDGYSVIGQGRIDEILALKSEDRREIFEEAAGVTAFRYRKEESERKLAATEENLVRIRDIYAELENQAQPLAQQAEKARQYVALYEKLRALDVTLWLLELEKLEKERISNQTAAEDCSEQLAKAREEQEICDTRRQQLAVELRTVEIEADRLRTQQREMEQERAAHQSRCAVLHTEIRNLNENIIRAQRDAVKSTERAKALEEQLAKQQQERLHLETEAQDLQKRLEACTKTRTEQTARLQEKTALLIAAQQSERTLLSTVHALEMERTAVQAGLHGTEARQATIQTELEQVTAQLAEEKARHTSYELSLAEQKTAWEAVQRELSVLCNKREVKQSRIQELTREETTFAVSMHDTDNRIRMLEEMEREYEGFSRSVKVVMQCKEQGMTGIHAPVSSLLTVEDRYVTAIETALGAAAGNLVVDTAQDGKRCIEYLKRTQNGRATFLPLDTIRPAALRENGLEHYAGFCGTADVLVRFAPCYQNIITNLLARTVIVETIDDALVLAKAYGNRFRIVTLDGQIIQSGGAMTGGSLGKSTGILARASKLKALRKQKTEQEQQYQTLQERLTVAKQRFAELQAEIQTSERNSGAIQAEKTRLMVMLDQHHAILETMQTRWDALHTERDTVSCTGIQYQEQIARLDEKLLQNRIAIDENSAQLDQLRQEVSRAEAEQATGGQEQTTVQVALQANRMAHQRTIQTITELDALYRELCIGLEQGEQTVSEFLAQIERAEAELVELGKQDVALDANLLEVQKLLEQQVAHRLHIEEARTKAEKQDNTVNDRILNLEREYGRLQAQAIQLKSQENTILDKLWEQYELTPTPAQELRLQLSDLARAKKQAAELREKIRALGAVNTNAVQEYAALQERLTFLGTQKDDLEKAQKDLRLVISELTIRMKEIFASEFARLNGYFGETFREIFGGGHASLVLADTADILNCGIDIHVSLPGKALKTITLLSGGEKALVAIALYFAILKVRPTPFCILDEIEAALDDVNVVRFARYLRRLTQNTQFIVVTHRRGTMEEADVLYGVTMQEQGVSKLLMLHLAEVEKKLGVAVR